MMGSKLLRVNLTDKIISVETVQDKDEKEYIGGAGVAAALVTREVDPNIDALNAGNLLIFSVGPFCGTSIPFCGRHFVTAKSPLTGMIGESSSGGFFGKELAAAGFHHVAITGKSDEPVYIWIEDGKAEIKNALNLWGKTTRETEAAIKSEIGDAKIKIASIGPAGENLVRFASIISEEDRAAGRCGLGAVMGSKMLKALAVRGTGKPVVADDEKVRAAAAELRKLTKESLFAGALGQYGTQSTLINGPGIGDVPVQNFSSSRWKGMSKLEPEALNAKGAKKHACFNCPIACTSVIEHGGSDRMTRAPEYETLAMLGTNILVDDLDKIIDWNIAVNDAGMDTISFGVTIAAFLEAVESGKFLELSLQDLGINKVEDPEKGEIYNVWGNTVVVDKLIGLVTRREEIGNDLAEGVKRFVEKHNLPIELATHGKGLEIPAHEPRANNMTALDYATTPRGAYHCYLPLNLSSNMAFKEEIGLNKMIDRFSTDDVLVDAVIKVQDSCEAYSACGGCIFGFQAINLLGPWIDALNAVTGRAYTVETWMEVGSRLINLKREYAEKTGISKKDDTIGPKFFQEIKKGGTKKNVPPLDILLPMYYKQRNW